MKKHSKTTKVTHLEVDGTNITGDINIANSFNDYFSTIGSKLADNSQYNDIDTLRYVTSASSVFQFQTIDSDKVRSALNNMKSNKAPGPDHMPIKLLKDAADSTADSLAEIFNLSIQTGIFSDG